MHPAVLCRVAALGLLLPAAAAATDLPPPVVASFTRTVQPLVLNKCAAGACHGGADRPAPALTRIDLPANATRTTTLANLRAFLDVVGPTRSASRFFLRVTDAHVEVPLGRLRQQVEFSPRERSTIHAWLALVKGAEQPLHDGQVVQASALVPADQPRANRFRDLLDAAANPPELPPPQEPQGVIFKSDVPPGDDDPRSP